MKVAFVVDTSPSMHVRAENGLTYLDAALAAIEVFIGARSKLADFKRDKYFLLSTAENYPEVILSSWEHDLDHFLAQLKLVKTLRTMNSLHTSLGYAFNLLSQFRTTGQPDILTGGRLVSKVIVLTDSDKVSTTTNVMGSITIPPIGKSTELYNAPFRWDQRLFIFGIKPQIGCSTKMYDLCQKLCNNVGGAFALVNNFTELKNVMETFATLSGCTIKLNYELSEDLQGAFLAHVDTGSFRSMLVKHPSIQFMTIGELLDTPMHLENWPFLDDFVINLRMDKLPTRTSHPTVTIAKEPKPFGIPERFPYDSYKILDPGFIGTFLKWTGADLSKIHEYRNLVWPVRLASNNQKQPFAAIRLVTGPVLGNMVGYSNLLESLNELPFSMENFYTKKYPQVWLEFIVLPYNYEELFALVKKGKTNNPRFMEELYVYLKSVPLYYHNYIQIMSDMVYRWGVNVAELKFEDRKVSKTLASEIGTIKAQSQQARKNMDLMYQAQKEAHAKNEAACCKPIKKDIIIPGKPTGSEKCTLFEELNPSFLLEKSHTAFQTIEKQLRSLSLDLPAEISVVSLKDVYANNHVNLPIAEMGNYALCLEKKKKLRNPHLTDMENMHESDVYFGNPYKRMHAKQVTDEKALESELLSTHPKPPDIEIENGTKSTEKYSALQEIAPAPTQPLVKMEEQKMESNESIASTYYSSCYTFRTTENSTTLHIRKEYSAGLENIKYGLYVEQVKDCMNFLVVNQIKIDSTKLWKQIRTFRPNSDTELLTTLNEIIEATQKLGAQYKSASKRFIGKIEGLLKSFKPSSPALVAIKRILQDL